MNIIVSERRYLMNREERIRAALAGQPVDHVPVGAWMHLSEFDQDPISLAEAEAAFTEKYDFDYIKMMPFGLYSTSATRLPFTATPTGNRLLKISPSRALRTTMP